MRKYVNDDNLNNKSANCLINFYETSRFYYIETKSKPYFVSLSSINENCDWINLLRTGKHVKTCISSCLFPM